jgi:hypothetical protein
VRVFQHSQSIHSITAMRLQAQTTEDVDDRADEAGNNCSQGYIGAFSFLDRNFQARYISFCTFSATWDGGDDCESNGIDDSLESAKNCGNGSAAK